MVSSRKGPGANAAEQVPEEVVPLMVQLIPAGELAMTPPPILPAAADTRTECIGPPGSELPESPQATARTRSTVTGAVPRMVDSGSRAM